MSSITKYPEKHGGCLCGAVRYKVTGPLRGVVACHCNQCRRTSGHYVAATATLDHHLVLIEDKGLKWYTAPDKIARRGFCKHCGSSLFWEPASGEHISIMAGTLDAPTGLATVAHIFTDFAGDYYDINDAVPLHQDGNHAVMIPTPATQPEVT